MFEVYDDFHQISHETVHLAVSFFDKYLSEPHTRIIVSNFQLIATCAMYMASKFIDIYPPSIKEFSRITNHTYPINYITFFKKFFRFSIILKNALLNTTSDN